MHSAPAPDDSTRHLPRILCLHGGGTNARIFRAQCRCIVAQLRSEFRLIFAQAPFDSQAGPDVLSAYSEWGPFRRWLRWLPEHPQIRPEDVVSQIDQCIQDAMGEDDANGATGEWVGLMGFSQGAKVSASLLYRQQVRQRLLGKHCAGSNFRFGILLAGRAPLVSLDPGLILSPALLDASQTTDAETWENTRLFRQDGGHVLRIPTLHVHGLRDKGLELHRRLFEEFCHPRSRRLIEWDEGHRVPLKFKDAALVVEQIRRLAQEARV